MLDVDLSEHVFPLLTIVVFFDQTFGNWYHFIKPIRHNKNLLTVKKSLNVGSCFNVFIFLSGLCKLLF
jgi:hypothetical protein